MAEKDDSKERGGGRGEDREDGGRDRGRSGSSRSDRNGSKVPGPELVRRARDQLVELTGRPAFGVSALTRSDDGWVARVEVVELERIPPSTSVVASYEVELDDDGNLVGYERTRRYHLSQTDE
jgi:Gas vesicle synthesis protein GvpO